MPPRLDLEQTLRHAALIRSTALDVLGDPHRAEDVLQDTLLAASHRAQRGVGPRALRAWLRGTARKLALAAGRGERRRYRREQQVAQAEAAPAPWEVLERVALQRRVAAAVEALPSPDREIVALRYWDEAPPREIARHLGLSVNTISTRLTRAKARLAKALEDDDPRPGASGSSVLALWDPRPAGHAPFTPLAPLGALAMKKLVFAAVLASILLVALVTWHSAEPQRPQPDTALALEASVELIAPAKAPGQPAALSLSRTTAVGDLEPAPPAALALAVPTEGATVGTLLVRVTERESGAPAPGVALEIVPWSPSHTWFHRRSAVTDEGGEVRFERVPPGRITVYLRRLTAADTFGAERVEVVAGETCEVSCQVIAGLTLHGTVRDAAGRAVAGADVWLATGAGAPEEGDPVTRTDADGRYRLRHASRFQGVAARAAGYAPSDVAVPLFAADGTAGEALGECQMDLVLPDLGGALEGLVVDSSGAPEADALIVIRAATRPERSEGGHRIYGPPDLLLRTDAAGRFRTDRMGAGTLHVCARGMDTGLAQAHVEVPVGGVGTVRLELGSSSTVFGRITTDRALPVFDAILELSGQDRRLVWSRARAAEDGSFELSGVPPGRITLSVQSKALDTGTNETFDLSPGERREWLPVLPTTGEIVGRVVDEHGAGLPRWSVRRDAEGDESGGPLAYGLAHTDAAGEFRLQGCLDGPHTLQVLPPGQLFAEPVATARGITPSSPILTLVVPKELIPSCTLRGRCLDAAGAPVAALISLQAVEPIVVLTECATDAAGVFRFEHLAATEYRVRIQVDGRSVDAPGSPVRLTPDTPAVDLGPLVLP